MNKIAILITCHNRREKTLKCLTALYRCTIPENYSFEVFLVNDGSTDGTSEAIKINFPDVTIVCGDGNLYWNRGMHLAWETASKTKDFDYYLWLNDDTFLEKNALQTLTIKTFDNAIVVGTTKSNETNLITYGGYKKSANSKLIPNETYQECDYFNGNCVLIPSAIFKKIGNLDPVFHHAVGDFDYGLRAKKVGFKLLVAPQFIGTCESHDTLPKWLSPDTTVNQRLKYLYLPTSGCSPKQYFFFDKRHNGLLTACLHFCTIHLRAVMPFLWNFKS